MSCLPTWLHGQNIIEGRKVGEKKEMASHSLLHKPYYQKKLAKTRKGEKSGEINVRMIFYRYTLWFSLVDCAFNKKEHKGKISFNRIDPYSTLKVKPVQLKLYFVQNGGIVCLLTQTCLCKKLAS